MIIFIPFNQSVRDRRIGKWTIQVYDQKEKDFSISNKYFIGPVDMSASKIEFFITDSYPAIQDGV